MGTTSTYECFLAALMDLWPRQYNKREALADDAGISKGMLSDILNRKRKASFDMQEKLAGVFKKDLIEFYEIGKQIIEKRSDQTVSNPPSAHETEPEYKPTRGRPKKKKITPLTHDQIIRLFKDPDRAKSISYMLAELEEKDPEGYARVEGFIKSEYERVAPKKRRKKEG